MLWLFLRPAFVSSHKFQCRFPKRFQCCETE